VSVSSTQLAESKAQAESLVAHGRVTKQQQSQTFLDDVVSFQICGAA